MYSIKQSLRKRSIKLPSTFSLFYFLVKNEWWAILGIILALILNLFIAYLTATFIAIVFKLSKVVQWLLVVLFFLFPGTDEQTTGQLDQYAQLTEQLDL